MRRETKDNVLMIVIGIVFLFNIIIMNIFPPIIKELVIVGYFLLGLGALFVFLSLYTLWKKSTSNIIDSGIYGVIRHPMYFGGMVMFFSHYLLSQNWLCAISTVVGIFCCYLIILSGDERNLEKFGDEYRLYMKSVPRINFILGLLRRYQDRK